ncbi:MAG: PqqD family protein [Bacteroidetes bacterium]|jgi:hypothetical protein|nr:PqqD family protein [Bacteroidota bacterium]
MKLKKNIATSESGFIFNPATGDSYSANPVGSDIILLMKDNKSIAEIKKNITSKYDVDDSQFDKDYDDLLAQLRDNNLLEH